MYDDKSDEEEPSYNDYTIYIDNICFFVSKLWFEIQKHINADYAVTGWMLCVIPHIRKDVFKSSNINHMIQVNTVIKNLFAGQSEKQLNETLDTFWIEYIKSNHNNDPFDSDEFIWIIKDISDGNSHLWHQKESLPYTKVLVLQISG